MPARTMLYKVLDKNNNVLIADPKIFANHTSVEDVIRMYNEQEEDYAQYNEDDCLEYWALPICYANLIYWGDEDHEMTTLARKEKLRKIKYIKQAYPALHKAGQMEKGLYKHIIDSIVLPFFPELVMQGITADKVMSEDGFLMQLDNLPGPYSMLFLRTIRALYETNVAHVYDLYNYAARTRGLRIENPKVRYITFFFSLYHKPTRVLGARNTWQCGTQNFYHSLANGILWPDNAEGLMGLHSRKCMLQPLSKSGVFASDGYETLEGFYYGTEPDTGDYTSDRARDLAATRRYANEDTYETYDAAVAYIFGHPCLVSDTDPHIPLYGTYNDSSNPV